ncbi:MAG: hypothetical protein QF922_07415 [SAR324 cluster bacterium]|nr:hypothetical protein [SAR324 cluster bacterium]
MNEEVRLVQTTVSGLAGRPEGLQPQMPPFPKSGADAGASEAGGNAKTRRAYAPLQAAVLQ